MKSLNESPSVRITHCRLTAEGLMVGFSDGQVFLYHETFLVRHRHQEADRVSDPDIIRRLAGTLPAIQPS